MPAKPTPEELTQFLQAFYDFMGGDAYNSNEYQTTQQVAGTTDDRAAPEPFLKNLDIVRGSKKCPSPMLTEVSVVIFFEYMINKASGMTPLAAKRIYEGLTKPPPTANSLPTTNKEYKEKYGAIMSHDGVTSHAELYPLLKTADLNKWKPTLFPVEVDGVIQQVLLKDGLVHGIREWLHPIMCFFLHTRDGADPDLTPKQFLGKKMKGFINCSVEDIINCFIVPMGKNGLRYGSVAVAAPAGPPSNAALDELAEGVAELRQATATNTTQLGTIAQATATNTAELGAIAQATATNAAQLGTIAQATATNTAQLGTIAQATATNTTQLAANTHETAELRDGFDNIVQATATNTAQLSTKLDANKQELDTKIDTTAQELRTKMDISAQELNNKIDANTEATSANTQATGANTNATNMNTEATNSNAAAIASITFGKARSTLVGAIAKFAKRKPNNDL